MRRSGLKRPWAIVAVAVGALLLLSTGGAILAAPVTLPLLYLAAGPDRADRAHGGVRVAALAVAGLTVAEIVWAATDVAVAGAEPWIWLLPVAAGAVTATVCARRPAGLATA